MLGKVSCKLNNWLTDGDGNVTLMFNVHAADKAAARELAAKAKKAAAEGKERLTIEVDLYREKRSTTANSYFWTLCNKLAKHYELSDTEVYREQIRNVGVWFDEVINTDRARTLRTAWERQGTGWITEPVSTSAQGDVIRFYYGSSVYNKEQMKRLIDNIVYECEQAGIETKTPDEIANMISLWEKQI